MPSTAGVQVDGARELRRTMKAAGRSLQDLKDAHAAAGAIVVPAARGAVPEESGRLGRTIRASVAAGALTIRAGGASTPYGGPIHWGWPKRHIKAQPFIADPAKTTEPAWTRAYEAGVDKVLRTIRGARP